jgi:hypothetical protein
MVVSREASTGGASRTPASAAEEVVVEPPVELELLPPELLVELAPADVPPEELLEALEPPLELLELDLLELLPPLPAELAPPLPPDALLEELLLPPFELSEPLVEPPPTLLLLAVPASLVQPTEPRLAKAKIADTNGTPYLEFMNASKHVGGHESY